MGACKACTFKHPNSGGWGPRCTGPGYGNNMGTGASTIKVYADDEDCLLTAHAGTDYTGRAMYLNVSNQSILNNLDARQRYHDNNWDNDPESIKVERIPSANQNQLEYHLPIKRYTPHKPGDNHCGGCRWWPDVKSSDPKNANRDDVLLKDINANEGWSNDYVGKPCPGTTTAYFNSKSGVKCIYNKNDANLLEILDRTIKDHGMIGDPRQPMYDYLRGETCKVSSNLNKVVTKDQKTCKDWDTSKALAKEWCEIDDNIVDDTLNLCTPAHLGADLYNTLAEQYCVSNPDKEFCKCYNVVNYKTVCANRPTSAGCAVAKTKLDSIEEKLGIANATDALPCGTACAGANVYKPDGFMSGCDITYNACIQQIDVGASYDEINAVCNIDSTSGITDGESGGSGGSSTVPTSVSTSAVDELKKTIAEDKKKEEEEAKKTKKNLLIGGGGGGIVSSISCLILIVIIVMVMSKKGGGGRRRR